MYFIVYIIYIYCYLLSFILIYCYLLLVIVIFLIIICCYFFFSLLILSFHIWHYLFIVIIVIAIITNYFKYYFFFGVFLLCFVLQILVGHELSTICPSSFWIDNRQGHNDIIARWCHPSHNWRFNNFQTDFPR